MPQPNAYQHDDIQARVKKMSDVSADIRDTIKMLHDQAEGLRNRGWGGATAEAYQRKHEELTGHFAQSHEVLDRTVQATGQGDRDMESADNDNASRFRR